MKNNLLYYSVGPLLYCPGNKATIAQSIINEKFGRQFSLALCLEDTINDRKSTMRVSVRNFSFRKFLSVYGIPHRF